MSKNKLNELIKMKSKGESDKNEEKIELIKEIIKMRNNKKTFKFIADTLDIPESKAYGLYQSVPLHKE